MSTVLRLDDGLADRIKQHCLDQLLFEAEQQAKEHKLGMHKNHGVRYRLLG